VELYRIWAADELRCQLHALAALIAGENPIYPGKEAKCSKKKKTRFNYLTTGIESGAQGPMTYIKSQKQFKYIP
jgi:hypothetical protein